MSDPIDDPNYDDSDSVESKTSETKVKSRRPADNAFRQQRLKAYHPVFTARTVTPVLLVIAVIFIPIGIAMYFASKNIQDLAIDYTFCETLASDSFSAIPDEYLDINLKDNYTYHPVWRYTLNESEPFEDERGLCTVQFEITRDLSPPIMFFYRLKDFYQNHRRYAKSFSEDQINGKASSLDDIKNTVGQNCQPLSDVNGTRIYPCGLIANSLFNDTYTSLVAVNGTSDDYIMTNDNTAWSTDPNRFKKTKYSADEVVPPPNWYKKFPNGYTDENLPDISNWPEFQNWMHTAGLPTFNKLALKNKNDVLKRGVYEVTVGLHFPVREFNGRKYIYLSTRSVLGGKNSFLGISWIAGGGVCLLAAILLTAVNLIKPRKLGDVSMLSWNKEKQQ